MRFYAAVTFFFFAFLEKSLCPPPHFSAPSYATVPISIFFLSDTQYQPEAVLLLLRKKKNSKKDTHTLTWN